MTVLLFMQDVANSVTCNFTKINTPSWVFFTFSKLYKWYQIAQRTTYNLNGLYGDVYMTCRTLYDCLTYLQFCRVSIGMIP